MSRPRLVDTATEADWSFMEDEWWVRGIRGACRSVARDYALEREELEHEMFLRVAVRPHLAGRPPKRVILLKEASQCAKAMVRARNREVLLGEEDCDE